MSEPKYVTEEREKARSLSNADLISFLISAAQGDDYDGMFTTRGENICQVYEDVAIERLEDLRSENTALRKQMRPVYVVTMYRYGDREKHSYVYGVFSTEATAREWGEKEKDYRGGKYEPEIIRFCVDSPTDFLKVKNG